MTPGITKAGTGIDGISWNILGQTYVPKQVSENSFSWHATFPPGTFVPPHIHPTQDEFIYMLDGRFDLVLEGREFVATTGDLIRLPMNLPHGIFNKTDQTVKCFFWVTPTRKLYDLFWAIHSMKEQKPAGRRRALGQARGHVPAAAGVVGPIGRRGRVGVEQFGLRLVSEQVWLGRSCHGLTGFPRIQSIFVDTTDE